MRLGKLGLFMFNVVVIVIVIGMISFNFGLWREGEIGFFEFVILSAVAIVFWRITKARGIQSLLGKIFGWDPFAGIDREQRRFNEWYNARVAANAYREQERAAEARRRYQAKSNAIFHEYQARKYAGSNDGYWHANMAKKYRNDAR